jgi:hypothetical protein
MEMPRSSAAGVAILAALHRARMRGHGDQRNLPGQHQKQAGKRGDHSHHRQTPVWSQQHSFDFTARTRE